MKVSINGKAVELGSSPDTPLLWALRDELGLTGTKFGCGAALCGACTVLKNGLPIRSCVTPISSLAADDSITTVEGNADKVAQAVKQAWHELDVVQCGFCQSGQLLAATALLSANPHPSDQDIDLAMSGNLCRCGTYPRIRAAIHAAAKLL
ncbi:(2Fe-2S)-binding protein [Chromobacterium violaceum]|uniref:Isoquinoline 1-oxidoreductase n=2 Tax=Chromobacterium violaceum TaxID=536 RepID=A0A1R0MUF6_CHRVL|nr:(2Fe-2S)-binding protein [Chromobacterium violaceum]NHQ80724.1 (2Fe-2S)-binding protein [Chromobacterium vaccinii]AAQ59349.1 probable aldehyde dehydrogenase (NAD) [Chromobacterium violaceum ATCC 12472]KJH68661.1 isoquinoline 1-oxidoreductase [Chromobacterium violaceum]KMN51265.1 isoquinoline 1-oxidoreductase [Chromobacterium violaceum]KMN86121.1 isoquinoline 1-oxidoreductase [Chromobacterium violaceum]